MYKIGELSRCLGLTVKTLRYWSDIGLLVPDETDRFTGYRYYSPSKLAEASGIIALKELGFSLDEIAAYSLGNRSELIEAKTAELKRLADETAKKLARLHELKTTLTEGKIMPDVIITSTEMPHAKLTRRSFASRDEALSELAKLESKPDQRKIIVSYDLEYRDYDLDLAIGVESPGAKPVITTSKGTKIASTVFADGRLDEAYRALTLRLAEEYQIVGPFVEIRHGDGVCELKVEVLKLCEETLVNPLEAMPQFEDDSDALGKWKLLDVVRCEEQFVAGRRKNDFDPWCGELHFLKNGGGYWMFSGWSKGTLFTALGKDHAPVANHYRIEKTDERTLMYIMMNTNRDSLGRLSGHPSVYIYEKVDSEPRTASDIARCDNIELDFIPDESALGTWYVCDFYSGWNPLDFDASKHNRARDDLFVRSLDFGKDGRVTCNFGGKEVIRSYTKGVIVSRGNKTASEYVITERDGKEYLLMQWKSGDYLFAGRINMYVFER